jgi:hypothetical protein
MGIMTVYNLSVIGSLASIFGVPGPDIYEHPDATLLVYQRQDIEEE